MIICIDKNGIYFFVEMAPNISMKDLFFVHDNQDFVYYDVENTG
jgi:hypothetical protein